MCTNEKPFKNHKEIEQKSTPALSKEFQELNESLNGYKYWKCINPIFNYSLSFLSMLKKNPNERFDIIRVEKGLNSSSKTLERVKDIHISDKLESKPKTQTKDIFEGNLLLLWIQIYIFLINLKFWIRKACDRQIIEDVCLFIKDVNKKSSNNDTPLIRGYAIIYWKNYSKI